MNLRSLLRIALLTALAVAVGVTPSGGEELILKNGEKIVGTIVGFENGMFRVETDFGMALVRKDRVASIQMGNSQPATPKPVASEPGKPKATEGGAVPSAAATSAATPKATPAPAPPVPPPPPPSHPLDEPPPAHVQEHVEGNTYINDTFQFAMFKPPDWKIYEGVPRETGSGIMAMGSQDEQTLLVVDRQVWSGAPALHDQRMEARLRTPYQEYQKLSEEPTRCGDAPALRRVFKGLIDGVEWHGMAVYVARDHTVFGIIGLTSADTFQFQEAVLNKIINSFRFLAATSGSPARPTTSALQ